MQKKSQPHLRVVPVSGSGSGSSEGYKSGRSLQRATPVTLSMSSTRSAGGRSNTSQAETVPWDFSPKARASANCPPAALHASSNARLLMRIVNDNPGDVVNGDPGDRRGKNRRMKRPVLPASDFWRRLEEAIGPQFENFNTNSLAKDLGMSQGTIHYWYLGKYLPELNTAVKLAKRGGVCVEWLISGARPKYPISKNPVLRELFEICEQINPKGEGHQQVLRTARHELMAQKEIERQEDERRGATGTHGRKSI